MYIKRLYSRAELYVTLNVRVFLAGTDPYVKTISTLSAAEYTITGSEIFQYKAIHIIVTSTNSIWSAS